MGNKDYSVNDLDVSGLQKYLGNQVGENYNIVRNYKTMCELLNEVPMDGNSRKAQVNRWKRYFDFHKDNQKLDRKSVV